MIARDGARISLWQATTDPFIPKQIPVNQKLYDVVIVGAGITGVSTALLLQKAGKKCVIVDSHSLCFGTTGATTAHLNTSLDTPYYIIEKNFNSEISAKVAKAAVQAIRLISNNTQAYKIDCDFKEAKAYLFACDDSHDRELEAIKKSCNKVGVLATDARAIPLPFEFSSAICIEGQAQFNPTKYVYGIARQFEDAGGVIIQNCKVLDTSREGENKIEVKTSLGSFTARDIVFATHIPPGLSILHLRCSPWRTYVLAVTLEDDNYPKHLSYDLNDPYNYFRTQEINGQPYLIVGGMDHKTGQETNSENHFRKLEGLVRSHFKVKEIAYSWSSQYFEPADGLPYIGHLPGHLENFYVATGFGGNGMIYGSVAAMLISNLILGIKDEMKNVFDPNRVKPIAGFTEFVSHNADAVKNLVKRLFPPDKLEELAGLALGEARIVKYENDRVGLYKDLQGSVHAINPVCTHLKCEVKWNDAELSWDCPCHGARFNCDGKVLTGPADRDLEIIHLPILEQSK